MVGGGWCFRCGLGFVGYWAGGLVKLRFGVDGRMDGWYMGIHKDVKSVFSALCVLGGSFSLLFFTSVPPGSDQQFPVLESRDRG